MPSTLKISDAESEIMKVLWDGKQSMTERQIVDTVTKKSNWSPTTIKTLIKRLLGKGALQREKKEVFYYWPVLEQSDFAKDRTTDLLDKVFGGRGIDLVSTMLHHDILSKEDIAVLSHYWQEKRTEDE